MKHSNTVTLIFEGSQGCQMNCTGCQINKQASYFPSPEQQQEIMDFLDSLEAGGFVLDEIELGPTDLLSTGNRKEFFSPFLKDLIERFRLTAFQVSLVHPPFAIREFAEDINRVANPKSKINISTPVEAKHVFNDKYIKRIKDNTQILRDLSISRVDEVVLLVIFDYLMLSNVGARYNYEELFQRVRDLSVGADTMVDFVFHHGRRNLSDPKIAEDFRSSFKEVNRFFEEDLKRSNGQSVINKIPFQLIIEEDRPIEVVWRAGKLYIRPILNEGFVVEDERFEFPKPWTAENYQLKLMEDFNRNLEIAYGIEDCQTCEHMTLCASRLMHDVMDMSHSDKCIYLLKDYKTIELENGSNYLSRVEQI